MKLLLLIALTCIYSDIFSQDINQDINTIAVKGITFRQVLDRLSGSGYSIDKLDYRSKIVRTRFSKYDARNGLLNLSITVQVRDSVAIITGRLCYNIRSARNVPDSVNSWEASYTHGPDKAAFLQLNNFAKSFRSEIIYSKTH